MKKKSIPDVEQLSAESTHLYDVLNEESDLACVLIATSYLDYAMASLLKRHFIESEIANKLLDSPRGAISTFATRSDLAYSFGLIPKGLYQNLETIGKIRNAFAHSYLSIALDSEDIAKLVDSLIPPTVHQTLTVEGDHSTHSGPQPMSLNGSSRDRFNTIVVVMVNMLLLTGLQTQHQEKKLKGWQ
jgi:DNA-binding MltR family transcriptional regulator